MGSGFGRHTVHYDGSSWVNSNGNRNVAYLWSNSDKRNLNLNWYENDWYSYYRFLAVRKLLRAAY